MREFNVLFGFKSEKIEDAIIKELQAMGKHVNATMRFSKKMISDFINSHPELDAVILKEYLDGGEKFSSRELAELADNSFVNIVVVLEQRHRGRESVKELYAAGILNAFFGDGKLGVNPDKLAEACVHSRTRAQAREYYRIKETVVSYDKLVYEEFLDCYRYLLNKEYGINIIDRFVTITRWLSPMQMASFILTVPESVNEILKGYDEYYDVCQKLFRLGCLDTKVKKTRQTKKGLSPEIFQSQMGQKKKPGQEVVLKSVATSRLEDMQGNAPQYEVEGDIMEMDPRPVNDMSGDPDIYAYSKSLEPQDTTRLSRKELRALKKEEKARLKAEKRQPKKKGMEQLPEFPDDGNYAKPVSGSMVLDVPQPDDLPSEDALYQNAVGPSAGHGTIQMPVQEPVFNGQMGAESPMAGTMGQQDVVVTQTDMGDIGQQGASSPVVQERDLSEMSVEELIQLYSK